MNIWIPDLRPSSYLALLYFVDFKYIHTHILCTHVYIWFLCGLNKLMFINAYHHAWCIEVKMLFFPSFKNIFHVCTQVQYPIPCARRWAGCFSSISTTLSHLLWKVGTTDTLLTGEGTTTEGMQRPDQHLKIVTGAAFV